MPKKAVDSSPYEIRGLESKKDKKQAYDVIASAFAKNIPMGKHMTSAIWKGPTFDPEHTRIAVKNGQVAGVAVMGPRMLRFGPARIPAMTVGPVATNTAFRGQGFCSIIMNELTRYMKENDYLIGYLAGAKALYSKYGYYGYYTPTVAKLKTEDSAREGLPGKLQNITPKHITILRKIFDQVTEDRIITAVRDTKVWQWLLTCGKNTWLFPNPKIILDKKGHAVGFCTFKSATHLEELVVKPDERSLRVALGALSKHAQKNNLERMTFNLPYDDPMFILLRHVVGTMVTVHAGSGSGNQFMVTDFPALIKALEPLFSQRWKNARTALPNSKFNLSCDTDTVSISIEGNQVQVDTPLKRAATAKIPRRWISHLITGSSSVEHLTQRQDVKISSKLKPTFNILFPQEYPFQYRGDSY